MFGRIPLCGAAALLLACLATGCTEWLDPLPDTPENLRLGIVVYSLQQDSSSPPFVSEADARATIAAASDVWDRSCGISMKVLSYQAVDAQALGVPYRAQDDTDISTLQIRFSNEHYTTVVYTPELRHTGDAPDDFTGGIGLYPSTYTTQRTILMAEASKYIFAHEYGHFLGLQHVADDPWPETDPNDPSNVMFPGDFPDSYERKFVPVQCAEAKRVLLSHEATRPACRPDSSDPELSQTDCPPIVPISP